MTPSQEKDRPAASEDLRTQAEALSDCRACALSEGRTQVVFGVGDAAADLLFVGEGPGFHEDRLGEPFVGQAGKLLTDLLAGIGLRREDVYIANVVKCRPPENRDPLPEEIEACSPNLVRQIQTIRPRVICTLGRFATRLVAQTDASISSIRGRAKAMEVAGAPVVVLPVFHPAAALYTPANRTVLEEDFQKLRRLLEAGERALVPNPSREPAVCAEAQTEDLPATRPEPAGPPEPVEEPPASEPTPVSIEPCTPGGDRTEQLHLW